MDEEIKLKKIISKGKGADEWLNHPTYRHVLTLIKADLLSQFEKTKFNDTDDREEIWRKIQSLNAISNRMQRIIRDGEVANKTLLERIKSKFKSNQ